MLSVLNHWYPFVQALGTLLIAATLLVYFLQLGAMRRQLDQNGRVNQTAQYQAALQLMFDWRSEIIANPELADGLREEPYFQEVFKEVPVARYFHTIKLFHILEHYWLLHDRGIIDDVMWTGWSHNLSLLMRQKETTFLWSKVKSAQVFNPRFSDFVDHALGEYLTQAKPDPAQKVVRARGSIFFATFTRRR